MNRLIPAIALSLSVLLTGNAVAQQRMGPPQKAFDACEGSSSGSTCSFEGRRGDTLSGTCGSPRDGNNEGLVCMPSNNRGGEQRGMGNEGDNRDRRGPPAEAISACDGSSEGSDCNFSGPRGDTISGSCRSHNDQLACTPSGMSRPR